MHQISENIDEKQQNASPARIPVLLPDMFVSFLSQKPKVNPHYAKVKKEAEVWINRKGSESELTQTSVFDNGHLRDSPEDAQDMMQSVQRRFSRAMKSYCNGALEHVARESDAKLPSIEEQLATRRLSSGVTPLFALVEYAHKLDLPDEIFEDPAIKEIERLGTDLVLLYLGKTHDVVRRTRQITVLPRSEDDAKLKQTCKFSFIRVLGARFYGFCCLSVMLLVSVGLNAPIGQFGSIFGLILWAKEGSGMRSPDDYDSIEAP
ncbi:uncharacterized protein KY384_007213 [Bacidia gigantensis]|uniref:uncharacterized protein n=1 Tax=Bacidia gigantensis TaxID=2732470 RepID=UPI001D03C1C7|nr:uncharacterized protein KY384_007213 [Bacidia gigantensis]KAG8528296.1 hypothetical protein KY384_007213 [Bacidia gigantensis]